MSNTRGFAVVKEEHRVHFQDVELAGKNKRLYVDIELPVRADSRSAGYDFFLPQLETILPGETKLLFTDVKAYMGDGEVLKLYPRSSLGVKKGLVLANTVGVIDSSYYENESNDGNIGVPLKNTSNKAVVLEAGERIAQGIFEYYLTADSDAVLKEERTGGFGSSGK